MKISTRLYLLPSNTIAAKRGIKKRLPSPNILLLLHWSDHCIPLHYFIIIESIIADLFLSYVYFIHSDIESNYCFCTHKGAHVLCLWRWFKQIPDWFHLSLSVKSNKMELLSLQHQLQILPEHHFKLKLLPYIPTICAILHHVPCTCGSIYSSLYTSILVVKEGSSSRSLVHLSEHWACQQLMWLLPAKNCPQEFEKPLGWPQNDNSPKCCLAFATSLS